MNMSEKNIPFETMTERYPSLSGCTESIEKAIAVIVQAFKGGNMLLLCGNGGSSADCDHISGELLKGFLSERSLSAEDKRAFSSYEGGQTLAECLQYGLPAIPLHAFSAASTAFGNDVDPMAFYAQMVMALGRPGDVLLGISTSGNAENVYKAVVTAKARGLLTIGLTGKNKSRLSDLCDVCIQVPETETYLVQELHLPVYHAICGAVEELAANAAQ